MVIAYRGVSMFGMVKMTKHKNAIGYSIEYVVSHGQTLFA